MSSNSLYFFLCAIKIYSIDIYKLNAEFSIDEDKPVICIRAITRTDGRQKTNSPSNGGRRRNVNARTNAHMFKDGSDHFSSSQPRARSSVSAMTYV